VLSKQRVFTPEFRIATVKRILDGESPSALCRQLGVKRGVLYRWCHAYRREGEAGLSRPVGRQPGGAAPSPVAPTDGAERLLARIGELERKVGQQAMLLDFFRGAFKRVKALTASSTGVTASSATPKSGR
jgi:transposase-like protein